MNHLPDLTREQLLELLQDAAKNWLAHDGLWFQAVERAHGLEQAIELDAEAWRTFTVIEARRIMARLDLKPGGGLKALERALGFRLYSFINTQETIWEGDDKLVFRMNACRVQVARQRKQLPDFPCKSVGVIEYTWFARTIDERIQTRCIACPPDEHPPEFFCAWEFTLKKS